MSTTEATTGRSDERNHVEAAPAWLFWSTTVVGAAISGFGVYGLWVNRGTGILDVRLTRWLMWFVGAILLHDLLIAPVVLAVGNGIGRIHPWVIRTPVRAGLALTGWVSLIAYPLLRGIGGRAQPGNDSVLPRNYVVGYIVLLAVIWAGAAGWSVWRRRREGSDA